MPTCRDVAEATSRDELAQLNIWHRTIVRWHLFRCPDCKNYNEQIRAIGQAAQGLYEDAGAEAGNLDKLEATILRDLEGGPDRDRPPSDD